MNDDLLTKFRDAVPLPDSATAQRIHMRATSGRARPMPRRRLVVALAVFAGAAGLIGFLAVPRTSPRHDVTTPGTGKGVIKEQVAWHVPLGEALSEASNEFGVAVVLPDTPLLQPSDADPTAAMMWVPPSESGVPKRLDKVDVGYASPTVTIEFRPTDLTPCGRASCDVVYPNALDEWKSWIYPGSSGRQIVFLNDGTPAILETGRIGNLLAFRLGPLTITIWAPDHVGQTGGVGPTGANGAGSSTTVSATDLEALAQSIVDRSGAA